MSTTLKLELSDELESQLLSRAREHNLSPEHFALQSLIQILNLPTTIEQTTATALFVITDLLHCLREAQLGQKTTIEVLASPITLHLAQILEASGQIRSFDRVNETEQPRLILHLNPEFVPPSPNLDIDDLNLANPLHPVIENLNHPDPQIRVQAVRSLGKLYRELS